MILKKNVCLHFFFRQVRKVEVLQIVKTPKTTFLFNKSYSLMGCFFARHP